MSEAKAEGASGGDRFPSWQVEVEGARTLVPAWSRRAEPRRMDQGVRGGTGPLRPGRNLTLHVQDNEIVKVTSPHDNR